MNWVIDSAYRRYEAPGGKRKIKSRLNVRQIERNRGDQKCPLTPLLVRTCPPLSTFLRFLKERGSIHEVHLLPFQNHRFRSLVARFVQRYHLNYDLPICHILPRRYVSIALGIARIKHSLRGSFNQSFTSFRFAFLRFILSVCASSTCARGLHLPRSCPFWRTSAAGLYSNLDGSRRVKASSPAWLAVHFLFCAPEGLPFVLNFPGSCIICIISILVALFPFLSVSSSSSSSFVTKSV